MSVVAYHWLVVVDRRSSFLDLLFHSETDTSVICCAI